jgi:uncharacterized protein YndB with AHSA1/START domain
MKLLFTSLLIMTSIGALAQSGKASTIKKTFKRSTTVSTLIDASPAKVWALLTHAEDIPRWNSTVVSIEGTIAKGEKIKLISSLDPDRTFKLKIKEMEQEKLLVWGDAVGKRRYTLEQTEEGLLFTMTEKISSPFFPLFANKIPSFDESFEQFAADLKKAAEE